VEKRARDGGNTTLGATDYTDYYRILLVNVLRKLYFSIALGATIGTIGAYSLPVQRVKLD